MFKFIILRKCSIIYYIDTREKFYYIVRRVGSGRLRGIKWGWGGFLWYFVINFFINLIFNNV